MLDSNLFMAKLAAVETPVPNVPGITMAQRQGGRTPEQTARIAGTGLEVWEIMKLYRSLGNNRRRLRCAFDWLTEEQLGAALKYAKLYPEPVAERLRAEDEAVETINRLIAQQHADTAQR
jgi:uncharacterized protein (DUF433 family)